MSFGMNNALGLRAPKGNFDLKSFNPRETPGVRGKGEKFEKRVNKAYKKIAEELRAEQAKLYANGASDEQVGSILIILQGVDASGKSGATNAILQAVSPQGVNVATFAEPVESIDDTDNRDFLARIRHELPGNGEIAIFDRSYYEDVLVSRVEGLSDVEEIDRRYDAIRRFEKKLEADGTRVIKVLLHISPQFQTKSFLSRLRNPAQRWRYSPSDLGVQKKWDEYQEAYARAIEKTNDVAPWYIVPSDKQDYARLVVRYLLLNELRNMNLEWPEVDFNLEKQLKKVEKAAVKAEEKAAKEDEKAAKNS
ncbi:PPK2 family polyphosphate kinase [Corynebacterium sp. HMSC22B11]|uniref:PPK2 family polyphosphate kinase n=1 Tax=Corynebacterium sp. HMSC22B11 TaxID=1581056 RepID=UPI001FEE97DA|nr:PPK2 family polyphosphate kinase [Corynebacterium sp. HMSC22B11]